jgi:hypothetical protein
MVQPAFATLLMPPVGCPALLTPGFLAAPVTTVPLPTVAAAADPKQRTASFRTTVSLPQYSAIGFVHPHHCGTGQMPLCSGKLPSPAIGVMVLLRFCERAPEQKPRSRKRSGFSYSARPSTLPEPRQASAMMMTNSPALDQKSALSDAR